MNKTPSQKLVFSIVIPVYGSEKNIPITISNIVDNLSLFPDYEVEIIMVCDGSPDHSYEEMLKCKHRYPSLIRTAKLTRNFGQAPAIHCGIDMARGDVIGVYSCDGQDPFSLFKDMIDAWEDGYKLVIASRKNRDHTGAVSFFAKNLHKFVHKYIDSRYPEGGFDFYVMDKEVAHEYCQIDVPNGSAAMQLIWLGYDYYEIPYDRIDREVGKSGYTIGRKVRFAFGLLTSYSPIMTQVWFFVGLLMLLLFVVLLLAAIVLAIGGNAIAVFVGLAAMLFLCTGLLLWAVCCLGEYTWRIYDNTKNRPRYVIAEQDE